MMASIEFVTILCSAEKCGLQFALPADFVNSRREDHNSFYCPNGHSRCYPAKTQEENKIANLEQALAAKTERIRQLEGGINFRDRLLANRKGQITRLSNKIKDIVSQ